VIGESLRCRIRSAGWRSNEYFKVLLLIQTPGGEQIQSNLENPHQHGDIEVCKKVIRTLF